MMVVGRRFSFKTFCACLALVTYAGTAIAMTEYSSSCGYNKRRQRTVYERNSSQSNSRGTQKNKPISISWEDYKSNQPSEPVIITDGEIVLYDNDASLIEKNCSFPKLRKLTINVKSLSNDAFTRFLKTLENPKSIFNLKLKNVKIPPSEIGNLTNLRYLYLSNNKLTTFPPEIGNLTNLKYLYFSYNGLRELSREIGNLKNLERLRLSNNKLTTLPPEIGNLTNLKYLDLSDNELKELPPKIGNLKNLEALNLNDNKLTTLPSEIGNLKNLKHLFLNNDELKELPPEIGNLRNLNVLCIDNNKLTELPSEIGNLTKLSSLGFRDDEDLISSSKPLENLINLRTAGGKEEIGNDLFKNNVLNLSNKDLTYVPLGILHAVYRDNAEELNLSNNDLDRLPAFIVQLQELKKLDLRRNEKIDSIAKVDDAVFGIPSLKSIKLTVNNEDREYNKDEIDAIRKERIDRIVNELHNIDPNRSIVDYLTRYKNKTPLSKQEMQKYVDHGKHNSLVRQRFLKALLTKLEAAD